MESRVFKEVSVKTAVVGTVTRIGDLDAIRRERNRFLAALIVRIMRRFADAVRGSVRSASPVHHRRSPAGAPRT